MPALSVVLLASVNSVNSDLCRGRVRVSVRVSVRAVITAKCIWLCYLTPATPAMPASYIKGTADGSGSTNCRRHFELQ